MEFLSNYYLIIIFLILIGYEYRHKPFIKNNFSITKTWFRVDSRALGIYRILLGWLCFWDIFRRWDYIDVFYSNLGISTYPNNYFSIFDYIGNDSLIVHTVFAIGILFSILLMIGYKSKLSHLITATIVISIHTYVTKVGNSADMFLNCMLIWTLFLPLGKSISIDSLFKSLSKFKENNVDELNDKKRGINPPVQIYSIAYFAMLIQISFIYFFTALDKDGWDWVYGKAFYNMLQLDVFVTPIGYYIREYITFPISNIFTTSAWYLEYSVPFLLFIPFYRHILKLFAIIALTSFHIAIRLSIKVGLFSQVMITSFALLLDKRILDYIKQKYLKKYKNNKFILFYDSDCGFCHYTVRIIKRLDVFNSLIFADSNTSIQKPDNFDNLADQTAILYNPKKNKQWTRHRAFGKILSLLPFGFLISWIFFIPIISSVFGFVYDRIASNRTRISTLFGLPACNIPGIELEEENEYQLPKKNIFTSFIYGIIYHIKSIIKIVSPILMFTMLVAASFSVIIHNPGVKHLFDSEKSKINRKQNEQKLEFGDMKILQKITTFPRMIQMWKMFSPNTPSQDKVIIIEAYLTEPFTDINNNGIWDKGEKFTDVNQNGVWNDTLKIDPFTGKEPILNSTDYSILMKDNSQLWRKFFENFKKPDYHKWKINSDRKNFVDWMLDPKNEYFKENLHGLQINSIRIWEVKQTNSSIDIKVNKKWDDAEKFTDINQNGIWDSGEPFDDFNNNFILDEYEYCWCSGGCIQLQKNDCEQYGFQWIEQETFQDVNGNGQYDPPEPLKDRNKNGKWDSAEEFLDDNENGMYDGPEFFVDHNKNGKWDEGEKLTDKNKNGKWDEGESFTDRVTGTIKYPKPNSCHQSKPKDSYLLGEDKKCEECYYLKSAVKTKCLYGCETDNSEKDNKCEEETTKATGKEKKEKAKSKNLKDYFNNNKK